MNGQERATRMLRGEAIDRPPLFDMIRHDAVIEHFTGEKLTYENGRRLVRLAHARAVDSTRMLPKLPVPPITDTLLDGRTAKYERWMRWAAPRDYGDFENYVREKKKVLAQPVLSEAERAEMRRAVGFGD